MNKVFSALKDSEFIYDVDLFYLKNFEAYGVHVPSIKAGGFKSDHDG